MWKRSESEIKERVQVRGERAHTSHIKCSLTNQYVSGIEEKKHAAVSIGRENVMILWLLNSGRMSGVEGEEWAFYK